MQSATKLEEPQLAALERKEEHCVYGEAGAGGAGAGCAGAQ